MRPYGFSDPSDAARPACRFSALAAIVLGSMAMSALASAQSPRWAQPTASAAPAEALQAMPWSQLNPVQRQSLQPLAAQWNQLSASQQRKWLALSRNFFSLSADDQARLHARMVDWAALSSQQRMQARLGYAQTQTIAPDDKRAQWEAYQALSDSEKQGLAAQAPRLPIGAATVVRPVSPNKIAVVPIPVGNPANPSRVPPPPSSFVRAPSEPRPAAQSSPAASP